MFAELFLKMIYASDPRTRFEEPSVEIRVVERSALHRLVTRMFMRDYAEMRGKPLKDTYRGREYNVPWDDIAWWLDSALLGL